MFLRVKISALWFFTAIAMLAHSVVFFMEPGAIQQIMTGVIEGWEMGPGILLFMALMFLVPLVMAFLTLILKDSIDRPLNIIMGIVFTGLNIFDFIGHLAHPSVHAILLVGSTIVVTILIVWHAWNWSK